MDDILKDNPLLASMDPEKIQFLLNFSQKEKPQKMTDVMPFLLANMNIAKNKNIHFSKPEIQLIVELLSKNLSPTEKTKVNRIMSMMVK